MTTQGRADLFKLCIDRGIDESFYHDVIKLIDDDHRNSDKANMEMNRLYEETKRKYENNQKAYIDAHERFNSKLMSVYYLLDMVSSAGTHGEKRNVIMYLKLVIENLIHKGDPLPINEDLLPF